MYRFIGLRDFSGDAWLLITIDDVYANFHGVFANRAQICFICRMFDKSLLYVDTRYDRSVYLPEPLNFLNIRIRTYTHTHTYGLAISMETFWCRSASFGKMFDD